MKCKEHGILVVILGLLVVFVVWFLNGWNAFLNNNERMPGRDTVAYWELKKEEFTYEICRSVEGFDFWAYDSLNTTSDPFIQLDGVHFYADTTDCIFIITNNNDFYSINKTKGSITASSLFDEVPTTEEQLCFINLYSKKGHISKSYSK